MLKEGRRTKEGETCQSEVVEAYASRTLRGVWIE
jgi:hypothetical protein